MNPTDGSFGDPGVRIAAVRERLPEQRVWRRSATPATRSSMKAIATKLGQLITPPCITGTIQTGHAGPAGVLGRRAPDRHAGQQEGHRRSRTATRTANAPPCWTLTHRRDGLHGGQQLTVNDTAGDQRPAARTAPSTARSACPASTAAGCPCPTDRHDLADPPRLAERVGAHAHARATIRASTDARSWLSLLGGGSRSETLVGSPHVRAFPGRNRGQVAAHDRGRRARRALPARHHRHAVRGAAAGRALRAARLLGRGADAGGPRGDAGRPGGRRTGTTGFASAEEALGRLEARTGGGPDGHLRLLDGGPPGAAPGAPLPGAHLGAGGDVDAAAAPAAGGAAGSGRWRGLPVDFRAHPRAAVPKLNGSDVSDPAIRYTNPGLRAFPDRRARGAARPHGRRARRPARDPNARAGGARAEGPHGADGGLARADRQPRQRGHRAPLARPLVPPRRAGRGARRPCSTGRRAFSPSTPAGRW